MSFRALSTALWFASALFVAYGLFVVAVAATSDASGLPLLGSVFSRPHFIDRASPILILLLFGWVLYEIFLKQREVHRQYTAIATFQSRMAAADGDNYQPKAFDLTQPRAIRRGDLIIECSRREPSSLHEAVPAAAALDAGTLAVSYRPLDVYAWILPVLGFIGTANGMASAISGFKNALRGGGQVQVEALASELSQSVIPGLASAFETTILALAAALVAYLCTSALRTWDQEALDQLDRLCIVLLSRIPQPPTADGPKVLAVLEGISAQLGNVLQAPAELGEAAKNLAEAAERFGATGEKLALVVESIGSAAEALESASGQSFSAAHAIRIVAEQVSTGKGEVPVDRPNGSSAMEELAGAIKDLQKAVAAPLHFTISRDKQS